jgi:hypothetical protein
MASSQGRQRRIRRQYWGYARSVLHYDIPSSTAKFSTEKWTNNHYTSTLHRVTSPISDKYRYSVAFFNEGVLD